MMVDKDRTMERLTLRQSRGFTLTELVVAMMIAIIVVGGIGLVMVDTQKGWTKTYNRVNSGVATDALVARKVFDALSRKAIVSHAEVGGDGEYIELYYYNDSSSSEADRYARLYVSKGDLEVEHGDLTAGTWSLASVAKEGASETISVAQNVKSATFSAKGSTVRMLLTLDNGSETAEVVCSSLRHN